MTLRNEIYEQTSVPKREVVFDEQNLDHGNFRESALYN